MELLRVKYKVWHMYSTGMGYSTSKSYYFRFKWVAIVFTSILRFSAPYDTVRMLYIPKYSIDSDLGVNWQDAGQWRCYQIYSIGDSLKELYEEATISEIDQDGGEIDTYGLNECDSEVYTAAIKQLNELVMKG